MTQRFNADTAALERRELLNKASARFDLEEWILGHVRPAAGQRVLDLGCGRGKQIFALAPLVGPGGAILGMDVSAEAVAEVNRRAAAEKLAHVSAVRADLDDCLAVLGERTFGLILSTYAIYYARDMVGLLRGLRAHLEEGGQGFHCGYAAGSNREIIDLVNGATQDPAQRVAPIEDFIANDQIDRLRDTHAEVRIVRLANRVEFPTADSVMCWWRNHNSHRPDLDDAVRRSVEVHVKEHGGFSLSKNVIGVHLHA